jgi:hypothetical protein
MGPAPRRRRPVAAGAHLPAAPTAASELGWQAFKLDYSTGGPLAAILGPAMPGYQMMFRLLWQFKRAEHALSSCFQSLKCSISRSLPRLREGARRGPGCRQPALNCSRRRRSPAHAPSCAGLCAAGPCCVPLPQRRRTRPPARPPAGREEVLALAKLFLQCRSTLAHFCSTMQTYLMTDVVDSERRPAPCAQAPGPFGPALLQLRMRMAALSQRAAQPGARPDPRPRPRRPAGEHHRFREALGGCRHLDQLRECHARMLDALARRALLHEPAVRREVDEIVSGVGRFRAAVADFDAAVGGWGWLWAWAGETGRLSGGDRAAWAAARAMGSSPQGRVGTSWLSGCALRCAAQVCEAVLRVGRHERAVQQQTAAGAWGSVAAQDEQLGVPHEQLQELRARLALVRQEYRVKLDKLTEAMAGQVRRCGCGCLGEAGGRALLPGCLLAAWRVPRRRGRQRAPTRPPTPATVQGLEEMPYLIARLQEGCAA